MSNRAETILVVGGGPTGMMMASELRRHGVECRIVDENEGPSIHSKALGVHARTMEIMEQLGIERELLERGTKVHGVNVYTSGGKDRIVHISFDELDAPYPFVLMLPQSATEAILNRHLERLGPGIERGVRLTKLTGDGAGFVPTSRLGLDLATAGGPSGHGFVATLVHSSGAEEQYRASWVLGCDGAHSTVRKALAIPFEGEPFPEDFMLADVHLDWDKPHDETHTFFSPEGVLACLPIPGKDRWRVIVDLGERESAAEKARGPSGASDPEVDLARFQAWMQRRGDPNVRLSDPGWVSHFRIQSRIVPRYRHGRAFLAGDAAHIHSPLGGQGMNSGLQDAHNLAWKLALTVRGLCDPAILDSYDIERRPVARENVRATERATRVVTLRHPVPREIRDRLAAFLSSLEVVQARIVRDAAGLSFSYRGSPIVGEHRASVFGANVTADRTTEKPSVFDCLDFGGAPRAGDRAPDVILSVGPDDTTMRLFELFRSTDHVLLLFDGGAFTPEGYEGFRAIAGEVGGQYGSLVRVHVVTPAPKRPAELAWCASVVLDSEGAAHRRYGAGSECAYLIRPDRYVAFRTQPADKAALIGFMSRVLRARPA